MSCISDTRVRSRCKLCNKLISPNETQWTFIESQNCVTSLGLRLIIILKIETEELVKRWCECCQQCSFRIQDCFNLLMEVQASAFVMQHAQLGSADIFSNTEGERCLLFECTKCNVKIVDMKKFIDHYEYHTLHDFQFTKHSTPLQRTVLSFGKLHAKDYECNDVKTEKSVKAEELSVAVDEDTTTVSDSLENGDVNTHEQIIVAVKRPEESPDCDSYHCNYCNYSWISKAELKTHILGSHMVPKKKVKEKERFQQNPRICKYCSTMVKHSEFGQHVFNCKNNENILCHMCGKCISQRAVKRHMYMHRELNKGTQTCTVCGKLFKTMQSLRSHMIVHDDSKKVVCEICGVKTHPYSLWKHVKKHKSKEKQCKICDKAFTFNYMLRAHAKTHENGGKHKKMRISVLGATHKCPKCSEDFTYLSMLNMHMREQHNEASPQLEAVFGCSLCEKTFDDQYSLRNHLMLIHGATKEEMQELRPSVQLGVFRCSLCKDVLQSEYGLRHHMKTVHGLQDRDMPSSMRRTCEKCDRSFSNKAGLTAHIKSVHLNIGGLTCELCNKNFKRYQGLITHRLIHLGKKPFECEVCLRTFRQRSDVVRHLQRHVRDGDVTLENAAARNNSESNKLKKLRIFLKDSACA